MYDYTTYVSEERWLVVSSEMTNKCTCGCSSVFVRSEELSSFAQVIAVMLVIHTSSYY